MLSHIRLKLEIELNNHEHGDGDGKTLKRHSPDVGECRRVAGCEVVSKISTSVV